MSHPFYHAKSSARKHGGEWEDYIAIHEWFDSTKAAYANIRHRAILHSSFGIYLAQQVFGEIFIRKSDGKPIPTRLIGEQHVIEDIGHIPTIEAWLSELPLQKWMGSPAKLSAEFDQEQGPQTYQAVQE